MGLIRSGQSPDAAFQLRPDFRYKGKTVMEEKEFKAKALREEQEKMIQNYRCLNPFAKKGQIVFTGSSLMQFFPVNELLQSLGIDCCVYNRGVTGFVTDQMLAHMDEMILDLAPAKLFINIGTNDLGRGMEEKLWENYPVIIRKVQDAFPDCRIYVMAYYPCNNLDDFGLTEEESRARFATRTPESLVRVNGRLKEMAKELGVAFIDVNEGLDDGRGVLKKEYCIDGVHLWPNGYVPVLRNLAPYLAE